MRREGLPTGDAERDLEEIYRYIEEFDSRESADPVLERILEVAEKLTIAPERGSQPSELRSIGIQEFRQLFFKPYRLVYRVHDARVVIYLIADGHTRQSRGRGLPGPPRIARRSRGQGLRASYTAPCSRARWHLGLDRCAAAGRRRAAKASNSSPASGAGARAVRPASTQSQRSCVRSTTSRSWRSSGSKICIGQSDAGEAARRDCEHTDQCNCNSSPLHPIPLFRHRQQR